MGTAVFTSLLRSKWMPQMPAPETSAMWRKQVLMTSWALSRWLISTASLVATTTRFSTP